MIEMSPAALAVSRLQAILTSFLLRRTKDSLLDGKRLIELPEKTISLVKLEFSDEESEIYKMVVSCVLLQSEGWRVLADRGQVTGEV